MVQKSNITDCIYCWVTISSSIKVKIKKPQFWGFFFILNNYINSMNTKYDLKLISVVIMGLFYISVGVEHFMDPYWFLQIVPPYLPYKFELVYISGFLEIVLGIMLLIPRTRVYAGWGLIMLLIAVYPANIYLAQTNGAAMNTTPLIAWARLPFQFVFIGLAYWHTK